MRETIIRAISGILYVSIILIVMFTTREWFLGLFFILAIITMSEFLKLVRLSSFVAYFLLVAAFYFLSYNNFYEKGIQLFLLLTLLVNCYLFSDIIRINKIPMFNKKKYIATYFYIIGGFIFLTLIPVLNLQREFMPHIIIGVFVLIWANDTFAYLVGKRFGKNKLLERVSPKKTVEGFFGGLVGALICSVFIYQIVSKSSNLGQPIYELWVWLVLAVIISVFGTIGDLIQSKLKRQAGVKDSGIIMPGHGGMYDRLDSIIYASPFVYAFLLIVNYVS